LKFAQSADGYIGRAGEEVAISNAICKRLVHQWRVEEAAIMVGTNTALVDNPQLNARHYPGANPVRVVLDRTGKLEQGIHLLNGKQQTLIFTEKEVTQTIPQTTWITIDFDENILTTILVHLHQRGIQSLLVEGGAVLLNAFLKEGLWDEGRVLTSPVKLRQGIAAPVLPLAKKEKTIELGTHQYTVYYQNEYCLTKEKSSQ
jgi:diaminohydroxyphosphoribosylaminopyrimidine deaminase/5-amino-6-(5-phosphoribosylamino)uracil reductase